MIDIIFAILPLLVASVVVVAIVYYCKKKYQNVSTTDELNDDATQTSKKRIEGKNVAFGISIGMCLGTGIGTVLSLFGIFSGSALTYGGCFGMLAGLIIGLCFEK